MKVANYFDVAIIGGGPAGLSAALILGRANRRVLLIDEGKPRNRVTYESHGFLTQDSVKPAQIRQIAQTQLEKYNNIIYKSDVAIDINNTNNHFEILTMKNDVFNVRKVIFSTGVKDKYPPIVGFEDIYGYSAFLCPYCDGWEHRNKPFAVLGSTNKMYDYTKEISNWSHDTILFTNGQSGLTFEQEQDLNLHGIQVIKKPIQAFQNKERMLQEIVLDDGSTIARQVLFIQHIDIEQATALPSKLGIKLNEKRAFETERHGKTNIYGIYIIGDAKNIFSGVMKAGYEGLEAAEVINAELIEEDWKQQSADR
ncbi:NAD(P)/FAD-dependent oxidoreductase [Bacillus solimangrovi]|uniref:FAD/NAD(P)-binding domain-containing protein n=1 Tax=Bacillus solimangrovi TaxID=1305675 RepID=A0A1E5LF63_9BACI|nr:NAD(P)/FAD-dependent oxidoreductase [Bacillus solimangrovi]OEH92696.1 hypothetical protein BFG57_01435 [Bacillus solimangrovi]